MLFVRATHSFAVLCLTWLEQTALYSLILELQIGMQTVRGVPNTRKRRAVIRSVYSPRVQWPRAARGIPNVTSRIQVKLDSIAHYWERAIVSDIRLYQGDVTV